MAKPITRQTELSTKKDIKEALLKMYGGIDSAWQDCADRINDAMDYWDLYFCKLGNKQFYTGNTQVFVPIVSDAVDARVTRFTNQVFPVNGRYVEAVTSDAELPQAQLALIDHYVDAAKLRNEVIPALFRNGDIEGQYNIYVSWRSFDRHVTTKKLKGPEVEGVEVEPEELGEEPIEDISEETITDAGPHVEVIPDTDVIMLPAMASSAEEAIMHYGGSVTIMRRWTKENINKAQKDGDITKEAAEELKERMEGGGNDERKDAAKGHLDAAGVKKGGKYTLVYETWTMVKVDDTRRIVRAFFGGSDLILGCKLNPYWCDLIPLISTPTKKIAMSGKGVPIVSKVAAMQYSANDFFNQGADSATYALLPIIMTDPAKNPRSASMVIDLAAVWEVDPNSTKFAEFPELYKAAIELVTSIKGQIFESLSVNPSMIAQRGSKKPSQAEIAAEQQIDILTVADVLTPFEHGILTPMVQRFVMYDAQFRDKPLAVRQFGADGAKQIMQEIPPQQMNNRIWYRWLGVEAARSSQQIQLQMAGLKVLSEIPPQMLHGRVLDMGPMAERFAEGTFGPKLAPLILKPLSDSIGMPAEQENELLAQGFDLPVAPTDDDREHIQKHMAVLKQGDPHGVVRGHIFKHQQQMAAKNQAAAGAQQGAQPPQQGGGQAGSVPRGRGKPRQPNGSLRPGQMQQMPVVGGR